MDPSYQLKDSYREEEDEDAQNSQASDSKQNIQIEEDHLIGNILKEDEDNENSNSFSNIGGEGQLMSNVQKTWTPDCYANQFMPAN